MERLLADSETPFTDFRVEDCNGLPRAVFDRIPPDQSSLLSYLLYPNKAFVGALYLDLLKVSDGELPGLSYEDHLFRFSAENMNVEVVAKEPAEMTGACARVNLSLSEAKFLLLKWAFECMRWEAIFWQSYSSAERGTENDGPGAK